ncbi:uncharacterized protein PAC_14192 [Phialocephala subalpina]|uniref:Methyltransferase domain-containing protein n=1 Tax=Phialocephala subalpina TaxID=576137 RepID=A0A1L7XGZ3_9HELO|nr:uncharacterized protein PAC_14192 [Phialocephala subalpina]
MSATVLSSMNDGVEDEDDVDIERRGLTITEIQREEEEASQAATANLDHEIEPHAPPEDQGAEEQVLEQEGEGEDDVAIPIVNTVGPAAPWQPFNNALAILNGLNPNQGGGVAEEEEKEVQMPAYVEDNGRFYSGLGAGSGYGICYLVIEEILRQDIQHEIWRLALDSKLYLFPPFNNDDEIRVLDVGTGTGSWAIDFADSRPLSEVLGTDIAFIQPAMIPTNIVFHLHDAETSWSPFSNPSFMEIHST